jgi:hypothetical protein
VLIGVLCLLSQSASVLHVVLVRHVHCAEHDEWLHATGEHAEGLASHRGDGAGDTSAFPAPGAADEHGHDHCLICSERREVLGLVPALPDLMALRREGLTSPPLRVDSTDAGRVYSFAPKISPPV